MKRIALLVAGVVVFLAQIVTAAVPSTLTYQGRLQDSSGSNVPNNVYTLAFKIYSTPSGGSPIWMETLPVQVTGGLFTAVLGNTTPLDATIFNGSSRYLGVTVNLDPEISPRIPLTSVGYAFLSDQADLAVLAQDLTCTGCVGNSDIASGAVSNNQLTDGAVSSSKLAPDAVGSSAIQSLAVGSDELANDAVTLSKIANLAVSESKIVDGAVTGSKIADGSITAADMGFGSVVGGNGGTIDDGTVNSDDLAPNSVTTSKIVDGAVNAGDIASNAVQSLHILDGIITAADLGTNSVGTDEITDGNVTSADLGTNSVVGGLSGDILDESITADDLAPSSVGTSEVSDASLTAADLLDEAGLDSSITTSFAIPFSGGGSINADSIDLTVPSAGFVVVTASGQLDVIHVTGNNTDVRFDLNLARVLGGDFRSLVIPSSSASATYKFPFSQTEIFRRSSAGAVTFWLNADIIDGLFGSGATLRQIHLVGVFVPTRY